MNTVTNLVHGLHIGDRAVEAFVNLVKNKGIGVGLFDYTTDNSYRKFNVKNNFPRTASYYNIQRRLEETPIPMKRFFNGKLTSAKNVDGLEVGWAYTTDINTYKLSRGYVSSADFDEFQNLLRGVSIDDNDDKYFTINKYRDIKNNGLENITSNFKAEYENGVKNRKNHLNLKDTSFFEEYTIKDLNKYQPGEIENIVLSTPLNKKDVRVIHGKHYFSFTNSKLGKEVPQKFNDEDLPLVIGNSIVLKNFKGEFGVSDGYGESITSHEQYKEKNISKITRNKAREGLLEYYKPLLTKSFKQTIDKLKYHPYTPELQYTLGVFEKEKYEYYNIEKENGYSGSTVAYDNGGSLVDGSTYTFYEEIDTPENTNVIDNFTYTTFNDGNSSNLLTYTNKLFKNGHIKSMINRFGENGISRGRNLKNHESGSEPPYCRTWTAHYQYCKIKDLINLGNESFSNLQKKLGSELRPNNASDRINNYSVLQDNGFVRITPQKEEGKIIQNYMFSIENLAWKDNNKLLSQEQRGPNGGRIMWFPPYNLKFTENVNVRWNGNNFIGRGEEIHTYINTERSGTLDFSILIDHPSMLNKWAENLGKEKNEEKKQELLRFFAGCDELKFDEIKKEDLENSENKEDEGENRELQLSPQTIKIVYVIYFPNNYSGVNEKFNDVFEKINSYNNTMNVTDINNFIHTFFSNKDSGLTIHHIKEFYKFGTENEGEKIFGYNKNNVEISGIEYWGLASSHGTQELNNNLANQRAYFVKEYFEEYCSIIKLSKSEPKIETGIINMKTNDVDSPDARLARAGVVIFNLKLKVDSIPVNENGINGYNDEKEISKNNRKKEYVSNSVVEIASSGNGYDNEYKYFSKIATDEYMVKPLIAKVKYFDPAYHSITPEGFNARLTFLHQCTRQGPTTSVSGGKVNSDSDNYLKYAGNLSFGRSPYCVLRIGDFFNTKILIDSLSINYDNGGGSQWDLNPVGAGVQPMMANITISFKFIGGQDISGPIERLQNAVSSNYYANASVYDKNAEYN